MDGRTVIISTNLKRWSYEETGSQHSRQPSPLLLSQQVLRERRMPPDMLTLTP